MIDDAYIEVDGGYGADGSKMAIDIAGVRGERGFLVLEGDFSDEFSRYMSDEDATRVSLQIGRDVAEKLYKSLAEVLWA
ncbi:hypothetical protein KGP36_06940 [Patescibacteria group bacterium]|nr:hypothetical protein [Patescibacteria group bacterium]